jgi:hypothetical protein
MNTARKNTLLAAADLPLEVDTPQAQLALSSRFYADPGKGRRAELLAHANIDVNKKFGPKIDPIIAQHVASTSHPATHRNYLDAEQALRTAFTDDKTKAMDRPGFIEALMAYCPQVGYAFPGTPSL